MPQPNQHTVTPKFDVDGKPLAVSDWNERRANGYVHPRDRAPETYIPTSLKKTDSHVELIITRDLARQYAPAALEQLAHIAANGRNETARVSACNAILDRAWGKPAATAEPRPQHKTQISVVFHDDPLKTTPPVIDLDANEA